MRAPPGSTCDLTFGYRSVVQMPFAAGSALPRWSDAAAAGMAFTSSEAGIRQPMMPVEHGRTEFGGAPRAFAAAAATFCAASTPPGAQTFDTLLLITMACSEAAGRAVRARPTMTGAPGNAFFVNSAANDGDGLSRAMTVSVMAIVLEGSSGGTKLNDDVPTRKP